MCTLNRSLASVSIGETSAARIVASPVMKSAVRQAGHGLRVRRAPVA
jgi:hypothetical protein